MCMVHVCVCVLGGGGGGGREGIMHMQPPLE